MSYEVHLETIGILKPELLRTVHMDRADFIGIVRDTLTECWPDEPDTLDAVAREIMPVAESMPRYPLGRWLTDRGCGCVVGEYLIATAELDRAATVQRFNDQVGISTMLADNPLSTELLRFGYAIDSALEVHLREVGLEGSGNYVSAIRSIEFIDNEGDNA